MQRLLITLVFLILSGCAHSLHMVHVGDFSPWSAPAKGQMIEARSEQFVVMQWVDNTDYVDQARQKLIEKCDGGRITGITTQFSTSLGFFSWTNKILMRGLCVKTAGKSDA
jgi:hypothetical protein